MSLQDKINYIVTSLKEIEPEDGFIVSFSSGRDSCVIKDIFTRNNIKATYYYCETSLENNTILEYIATYHPEVIKLPPIKTIYELIKEHRKVPTIDDRFCCHENLYQLTRNISRINNTIVTGSRNNILFKKHKYYFTQKTLGVLTINPIFDWTTEEVKEYCDYYNLPLLPTYELYGRSYNCVCCPRMYASSKKLMQEYHPEVFNKLKKVVFEVWEENLDLHTEYKTPEDYWDYYINCDVEVECNKVRLRENQLTYKR